jgi:hypothetical protein
VRDPHRARTHALNLDRRTVPGGIDRLLQVGELACGMIDPYSTGAGADASAEGVGIAGIPHSVSIRISLKRIRIPWAVVCAAELPGLRILEKLLEVAVAIEIAEDRPHDI